MACCGSQAVPRSVSTAAPSLSPTSEGGAAAAQASVIVNIQYPPPPESPVICLVTERPRTLSAHKDCFSKRPRTGNVRCFVSYGSVRALSGPYRFTFFFLPLPLLAAPGSSPLLGRSARCGGAASTSAHGSKPMV